MENQNKSMKKRLDRRSFLKVLGGTAITAALAACGQSSPPAAAPTTAASAPTAGAGSTAATSAPQTGAPAQPKGLTLRALVYSWPPTVALRDALSEYEKLTGVHVEWEEAPYDDLIAKQMTELTTKSGRYDIFVPSNVWNAQLSATGNVEPLDDYIAKAGATLDYQDFFQMARDQYTYKGKIYGLPQSLNTYLSAWRTDVFDQEGIKAPADGIFAADQYVQIAKQLTKGDKYGSAYPPKNNGIGHHWSGAFITAGGRYFDEKLNPTFNSKEGLIAATFWNDLLPAMPPDVLNYTHVEANQGMAQGRILTQAVMSAGRIPMLTDPKQSQIVGKVGWGVVPYKGLGNSKFQAGQNFSDGFGLYIPKDSKHKQEAWDFCVWAVDKPKQVRWADVPVLPTRKSVFSNPDLLKKQPWLTAIQHQLDNTFVYPQIAEWNDILNTITTELTGAFSKQRTVNEGLDRINNAVTSLLKDRGYPVGTWTGSKLPWE